jgi:hypothetical protein
MKNKSRREFPKKPDLEMNLVVKGSSGVGACGKVEISDRLVSIGCRTFVFCVIHGTMIHECLSTSRITLQLLPSVSIGKEYQTTIKKLQ